MRRIGQGVGGGVLAAVACGVLSSPLLMWTAGVAAAPDRRWMPPPPSLGLVLAVAAGCAVGCLGAGVALLARGPRALGAGVVCGWLVAGLATQGWAVGLAPDLYAPERRYAPFTDRFTPLPREEAERRARAELHEAARLAGGRPGEVRRVPRPGDCWVYAGRGTGLVEPAGTGRVEFTTTIGTDHGQALVDRVADRLSRGRHAVGRKHEAAFENGDGVRTELLPGEHDQDLTIRARTPCLRLGG
ncbi:hypothetical protein [Actinomadura kijaniata]|uniref:hypothetical protein n=1 Tax=Actinomadura kijaniata TaxID=46161 RepID=UPI000829807F|nr:hypothetical protein [Actinomadura kijaniata]